MAGQEWMNTPFEESPYESATWNLEPGAQLAGGVVVLATVIEVPGLGPQPGVVFRFADAENNFLPPICLLLDDEHLDGAADLVHQAVHAAIRGARKARSNPPT